MLVKKIYHRLALLFLLVLFTACRQKLNSNTVDIKDMRIPAAGNDSISLGIDKSPMDMIYFPEDYPKQKMVTPNMPDPLQGSFTAGHKKAAG